MDSGASQREAVPQGDTLVLRGLHLLQGFSQLIWIHCKNHTRPSPSCVCKAHWPGQAETPGDGEAQRGPWPISPAPSKQLHPSSLPPPREEGAGCRKAAVSQRQERLREGAASRPAGWSREQRRPSPPGVCLAEGWDPVRQLGAWMKASGEAGVGVGVRSHSEWHLLEGRKTWGKAASFTGRQGFGFTGFLCLQDLQLCFCPPPPDLLKAEGCRESSPAAGTLPTSPLAGAKAPQVNGKGESLSQRGAQQERAKRPSATSRPWKRQRLQTWAQPFAFQPPVPAAKDQVLRQTGFYLMANL